MIIILTYTNILIFVLLSGLHFYWLFGGKWALSTSLPTSTAQKPAFVPGLASTLIVAIGLLFFASVVYAQIAMSTFIDPKYIDYLTLAIAFIFFLRSIGDFKYVGLFKRIKGTPFAKNDARIYIPLCLCLAISCLLIVIL